jgi:hypothetical protein
MYVCVCMCMYICMQICTVCSRMFVSMYRRLASFLEHVKKNNQDEGGVLYRLDDDAIHAGLDINKAH